jgi:hypothetical protein
MPRFTTSIATPKPKVPTGYLHIDETVFCWEGSEGKWYFFNTTNGSTGNSALQSHDEFVQQSQNYIPVYEDITFTIGKE